MISNRDIEKLLSGHWKSLTRTQQVDMARELMTYRKARQVYEPRHGDVPIVDTERASHEQHSI